MSHVDEGTLHAYLDEELTPAAVAELRAHLAACAACRANLDQARRIRERAHAILRMADPPAVVAPDFASLAERADRSREEGNPSRRSRALLLPWAASIVLAVGAGWFAQTLLTRSGADTATIALEQASARSAGAPSPEAMFEAAPPSAGTEGTGMAAAKSGTETTPQRAEPSPPEAVMAARARADEPDEAVVMDTRTDLPVAPQPPPGRLAATDGLADEDREGAGVARAIDPVGVAASTHAQAMQAPTTAPLPASGGAPAEVRGAMAARAMTGAMAEADAAPPPAVAPPTVPVISSDPRWPDQWRTIERDSAALVLGQATVQVADLPVVAYQIGVGIERSAVRVVQRLPGGQTVEVRQRLLAPGQVVPRRITVAAESRVVGVVAADSTAVGPEGGRLEIRMEAAISTDSLRRLMEALR